MLKVVTAQQQRLTRAFWLQAEPDFTKHISSSTCQCSALLARAEVCEDGVFASLSWQREVFAWYTHAWEVVCSSSGQGGSTWQRCRELLGHTRMLLGAAVVNQVASGPIGQLSHFSENSWEFLRWCEAHGIGTVSMSTYYGVCCKRGRYFTCSLPPPPLLPWPHSFKYVLIMAA